MTDDLWSLNYIFCCAFRGFVRSWQTIFQIFYRMLFIGYKRSAKTSSKVKYERNQRILYFYNTFLFLAIKFASEYNKHIFRDSYICLYFIRIGNTLASNGFRNPTKPKATLNSVILLKDITATQALEGANIYNIYISNLIIAVLFTSIEQARNEDRELIFSLEIMASIIIYIYTSVLSDICIVGMLIA